MAICIGPLTLAGAAAILGIAPSLVQQSCRSGLLIHRTDGISYGTRWYIWLPAGANRRLGRQLQRTLKQLKFQGPQP